MARDFNGSTQWGTIPPLPLAGAGTVACWVLADTWSYPSAEFGVVGLFGRCGWGADAEGDLGLRLAHDAGQLRAYVQTAGGRIETGVAAAGLTAARWYHLAAVFTTADNTVRLFLDGAQVAQGTTTGTFTAPGAGNAFGLAAFPGNTTNTAFDGRLAGCAVWTAALEAGEVAQLAAGAPPERVRPAALGCHVPLRGWQSPEPDLTPFGRAATLYGAPAAAGHPPLQPPVLAGDHWRRQRRALLLLAVPAAAPPQTAAPAADTSVGAWTTDTGATTTLSAAIDEASPGSDADYVRSEVAPVASVYEASLASLLDPLSSADHTVSVRALLDVAGAAATVTTELRQGSSALSTPASWSDSLTTSAQTFTHTLSGAQADAITDYAGLRLRFTADQAAQPTPTFVAASALASTATNGATFTPAIPTGTNGQDILLLMLFRNDNSSPTAPSGWTQVDAALDGVNSSTSIQSTRWYWRLAAGTAGSGTSTTATAITYGTSTILRGGRMYAFRGVHTTTPFATVSGGGGAYTRLNNAHQASGAGSATNTTDLTPVETNALGFVVGVAYGQRATATVTGASGWSTPDLLSTTTGTDATVTHATKAFTTPSLLDNPSLSTSTTTTAGVSTGFLFALHPPPNTSRVRVTWAQLAVPASSGETRSVAGAQASGAGALTRVLGGARAPAGAQPVTAGAGTLARRIQVARALAGAQPTPAAAGTLARRLLAPRAGAGAQGAAAGTLTVQATVARSLAGAQLAAGGTLTRRLFALRAAAGAVGSGAGTLARVLGAPRTGAGAQLTATGTLARVLGALRAAAGAQPAASGTLSRAQLVLRALSGAQGAPGGALAGQISVSRAVAGAVASGAGTLACRLLAFRSGAGAQPAPAGTLSKTVATSRAVTGAQPAASGSVALRLLAQRALSGAQGAATGSLARAQLRFRSFAGAQSSGAGTLSGQISVARALAGAQGAASGTLTRLLVRVRVPAGAQPAPGGTLARRLLALRALVGAAASGAGTLARRIQVAPAPLGGALPSGAGALQQTKQSARALSGAQGAPSGSLGIAVGGYAPPVDPPTGAEPVLPSGGPAGVLVEAGGANGGTAALVSRHGGALVEIG